MREQDRHWQWAIVAFPASLLDPQFRAVVDGLNKGADQPDERPDPTQGALGTARREKERIIIERRNQCDG